MKVSNKRVHIISSNLVKFTKDFNFKFTQISVGKPKDISLNKSDRKES